jgi:hypothetical protein
LTYTETPLENKGITMFSRLARVKRKSKQGRPRKYTIEFLESVPALMAAGQTLEQIASQVHGRPSTIVALCYRNKIMLPGARKHRLFVRVSFKTVARMQAYASQQKINCNELAERLLEEIARDNMFKAVLDD